MDEYPEKCILCDGDLSSKPTRFVKKKAIGTFIRASLKKCDNKDTLLSKYEELVVHTMCAMRYPSGVTLADFVDSSEPSSFSTIESQPSTSSTTFNFNNTCFYCNEDASEKFIEKQKRLGVHRRQVVRIVNQTVLNEVKASEAKESFEILSRFPDIDDLIRHQARYHEKCRQKFKLLNLHTARRGNNDSHPKDGVINLICSHIVNNRDECQFSINEILQKSNVTEIPNENYLKNKLQITFGSDVAVHSSKSDLIVSLIRTGKKILTSHWYKQKKSTDTAERKRIVETAATIILEDIRAKVYEKNSYPAPDCFLDSAETEIPDTLRSFFETVFAKSKDSAKSNVKSTALSHAVISIVRPRSFLSTLQIGLGSIVNKKFGSKRLIDILSAMGFCAPYEDITLFESSVSQANKDSKYEESFVRFVCDAADHNSKSIDGQNNDTIVTRGEQINSDESEIICEELGDEDISTLYHLDMNSDESESRCETKTSLNEPPQKRSQF